MRYTVYMVDTISDSLTAIAFPTAPTTKAPPPILVYASAWRRAAAGLIDLLLVGAIALATTFFMRPMLADNTAPLYAIAIFAIFVVNFVLPAVYFAVFSATSGATLGKRAMGIRVVGENGEEHISFARICLRELVGKPISILILGIGYLMLLWDAKKQALHDKMAKTVVVKTT